MEFAKMNLSQAPCCGHATFDLRDFRDGDPGVHCKLRMSESWTVARVQGMGPVGRYRR